MVGLYRAAAEQCTDPVGAFVNNQIAYFTFVHCAETDEQAVFEAAAAAAAWYTVTALTFFDGAAAFALHAADQQRLLEDPAGGGLTGQFLRDEASSGLGPNRAQIAVGRIMRGEPVPDAELFAALSAQGSLIVGGPETCRAKIQAYAELGIDRLMCFQQVGAIPHERVLESMRLIGGLIPEFDR
jgi:alkanesulfonate monooxygenase SsuD/methylene tetrahydromethanopterin reductase-like flavin-dependent oxidoreductase (luciferase family)